MATTDRCAEYHAPILEKYVRYVFPHFTESQFQALGEVINAGGMEMCAIHEMALAKFLGMVRESGNGYDLRCIKTNETKEAKYRRLRHNGDNNYLMRLSPQDLKFKSADSLWVTVYNPFIDNEDHFEIPLKDITVKSFSFTYNREADSYNRGDQYLVRRGFFV
jgi:hypothetical protein